MLSGDNLEDLIKDIVLIKGEYKLVHVPEFDQEVLSFDKQVTGINREECLKFWVRKGACDRIIVQDSITNKIRGYGMVTYKLNNDEIWIGPIVAEDLQIEGVIILFELLNLIKKDIGDSKTEKFTEIVVFKESGLEKILSLVGFKPVLNINLMTNQALPQSWHPTFTNIFALMAPGYSPF